jgi:Ca2+-transporting ATPase
MWHNIFATNSKPTSPFQTPQVNLIMDTLGALALATEPPTDELMTRAPVGRFSSLITNVMWRNIFGMALYQLAILLVLQFMGTKLLGLGKSEYDQLVLKTVIFNSFVLCQVRGEASVWSYKFGGSLV